MRTEPDERDDAVLLRGVARGDEAALAALYDRHAAWLTVRLTRRCALPDVVDHAVQDTFLALWREAGTYRAGGDVAAFIWGIGVRRLIDAIRRENGGRRRLPWRVAEPEVVVSAEDQVLVGIEHGAFVPRTPIRPLAQTLPVPAWVSAAGHLVLAAPVLAVTCWAQLLIAAHTTPPRAVGHPPAVYPVLAQLAAWCAITVAAAACVDRSRYADLGGAIAAPAGFAAIALAWYSPVTRTIVTGPPAAAHGVTTAWSVIAAGALGLAGAAMGDRWHRYSRHRFSRTGSGRPTGQRREPAAPAPRSAG